MKKIIFLFCFLLSNQALAAGLDEDNYQNYPSSELGSLPSIHDIKIEQKSVFGDFFFKPALSIEYNAPRISRSGANSSFRVSGALFHQVGDLQNIALGGNFRVHKHLGFNANWVQSELVNSELQGMGTLSERAQFSFDQYNLSALFYVPVIENFFEIFAEGGVADMRGRLTYTPAGGSAVNETSHQTVGLYGAGFQIILNEKDTIRLSWQRYAGKIGLINSDYSTMRVGYLMSF
ncbi:MAG: hypothetical protein KGP29_01720 [Proteobacteria bacterium]|nr:hypothetical protein [Pseudomonadota bacterium]